MKLKSIYKSLILATALLLVAACRNETNKPGKHQQLKGNKTNITLRATLNNYTSQNRDSIEQNIDLKWKNSGELIRVFGYTGMPSLAYSAEIPSIKNSLEQNSIIFSGPIDLKDTYLPMYPADNCKYQPEGNYVLSTFFSRSPLITQDCSKGNDMKHLKQTDIMVGSFKVGGLVTDYDFKHMAVMLCFDITLPNRVKSSISNVCLASPNPIIGKDLKTTINALKKVSCSVTEYVDCVNLPIKNHQAANTLKAYMMVPGIDLTTPQTLIITVSTTTGEKYTGSITTSTGTNLSPGKCYTLKTKYTLCKS